ncbi:MAG: hypothetical protein GW773_03800 [Candidatus Pacebacteria bacterium]|nr:hypothetical protein [Candidatus Paceibacterota bacterium]
MPAQTQQPSEKVRNLKRFLEKSKTNFYRDNDELLSWLQDRNLKVENLGEFDPTESNRSIVSNNSVESKVINEFNQISSKEKLLESKISAEEFNSIFEKLNDLLSLPAGQLENQSELYLEQQLSDLLGFDIVANLDDHRLNHSTGVMGSEAHLKRSPNDQLKNHLNLLEAGLDRSRSAFGWFVNHGDITKEAEDFEKYYFSLQLYQLQDWNTNFKDLKSWYKFRKMVVINPAEKIAIVGVVGNIDHKNQFQHQFGASPEVIIKGRIWSPKSQGKVLIMFVDDPKNEVPLGPIYFDKLFKSDR